MSGTPLIRPAGTGDADAVAGVCTRAARAAYAALVTPGYLDGVVSHFFGSQRLAREVTAGPGWFGFTVADDGSRVVGAAGTGWSVEHPAACELFSLYVDPPWQRRGIGRALVAHSIATAGSAGASRLDVAVLPGNLPAARFYEACGFSFAGQRPIYAPHGAEGGPQVALVYSRHL